MSVSKYTSLFLLAVILASCGSQRKLATEFVMQEAQIHVLLLPPLQIQKSYYPINPDSIAAGQQIASSLHDSHYLRFIEDSLWVRLFMSSLTQNLIAFDVMVYGPEDIDAFLQLDSLAYVFSVAQLEVLEYNENDLRYALLDTTVYEVEFNKMTFRQDIWFEFTELNHPERPMQVLFSSQFTSDVFDGRFRRNVLSGEMFYEFQPYRLRFEDFYYLANFAGQKNAQFIFDFLLNKYVDENYRRSRQTIDYLQYDRERHNIRRAYNDRFIRIAIPNSD